jgi:hypothetical protein
MNDELKDKLERFALKHKLILEEAGEVGFCRPCVGYIKGNGYVNFNPTGSVVYKPIFPDDEYYSAPVKDAYHKHNCLAVLVHDDDYETALIQLGQWVDEIESRGGCVVDYITGATGIQALLSGLVGYAFRFTN